MTRAQRFGAYTNADLIFRAARHRSIARCHEAAGDRHWAEGRVVAARREWGLMDEHVDEACALEWELNCRDGSPPDATSIADVFFS
jgi:hypothetical protein